MKTNPSLEKATVELLNEIIKTRKIEFLDFKIRITSVKSIDEAYELTYNIVHYGLENDKRETRHNLTGITCVNISSFTQDEVIRATYIAILQKLRHEAAELFKVDGEDIFNEHFSKNKSGAEFSMIQAIIG